MPEGLAKTMEAAAAHQQAQLINNNNRDIGGGRLTRGIDENNRGVGGLDELDI